MSHDIAPTDPTYILLYVENPPESAAFYEKLLGKKPVESSPGFVLFVLSSGVKLGFWKRSDVEPTAEESRGGGELAFTVADAAEVETKLGEWTRLGVRIVQKPTKLDFGFTFTGLDPDGHRLRVFAPMR